MHRNTNTEAGEGGFQSRAFRFVPCIYFLPHQRQKVEKGRSASIDGIPKVPSTFTVLEEICALPQRALPEASLERGCWRVLKLNPGVAGPPPNLKLSPQRIPSHLSPREPIAHQGLSTIPSRDVFGLAQRALVNEMIMLEI